MSSKSNNFENELLLLLFNATSIADIAEDDTTSPATTLTVALHTADPGETGTQLTSEATYTAYARQTVARTSGGWTVTANSVSPAANIDFPEATAGSETITHFSIGSGVSDDIKYYGAVTPNIVVTTGVLPVIKSTSTITED